MGECGVIEVLQEGRHGGKWFGRGRWGTDKVVWYLVIEWETRSGDWQRGSENKSRKEKRGLGGLDCWPKYQVNYGLKALNHLCQYGERTVMKEGIPECS